MKQYRLIRFLYLILPIVSGNVNLPSLSGLEDVKPILPDYWKGKYGTTLNGTMMDSIPLQIRASVNTYIEKADETTPNSEVEKLKAVQNDPNVVEISEKNVLPSNDLPINKTGTVHSVLLKRGYITDIEVLDEFNYDGNNSVPVRFSTSWYEIDKDKSYNHSNHILSESVMNGNVLNISWFIDFYRISDTKSAEENKDKKWEIDKLFCYYEHTNAHLIDGKCTIDYTQIIEHYLRLWNAGKPEPTAYNGIFRRVTNNATFIKNYECGISEGPEFYQKCENASFFDPIYYIPVEEKFIAENSIIYQLKVKPTGLGWATETKFGLNKTKGTIDLNFTMIFRNWTEDFPEHLLKSYQDRTFYYEKFSIKIYYWVENKKPKIERRVPIFFWFLGLVFVIPAFILLLAAMLIILSGSKYAFVDDVWKYLHTDFKKISEELKRQEKEEREMRARNRKDNHIKGVLTHVRENCSSVDKAFVHH